MTGSTDPTLTDDYELLVAYLDGELPAADATAVEQRLSQDEAFRKLLRGLQETWDLLDDLPHPTVGDGFTKTTVEMVAVKLSADVDREAIKQRSRAQWRTWTTLLATLAGLLAGFVLIRSSESQGDRQLINDLPIIERVDEFSQIESVELLQALVSAGVFLENFETDANRTPAKVAAGSTRVETLSASERRDYLAKLAASDQQALREKQTRFDQLSAAEQDRLREIHAQITAAPNAAELEFVLESYVNWLADLSTNEQFEVRSLRDFKARVARISEMRVRKDDEQLRKLGLTSEDVKPITDWFDKMARTYRQAILANVQDDNGPHPPENQFFNGFVCMNHRAMEVFQQQLSPEDIDQLLHNVSPGAANRYTKLNDSQAQAALLSEWIRNSAFFQLRQVSDAQIKRMLAELPPEERSRLESLPRKKIFEELRGRAQMGGRWRRPNGGRRPGFDGPNGPPPDDERRPFRNRERDGGPPPPRFGPPPAPPGPAAKREPIDKTRPEAATEATPPPPNASGSSDAPASSAAATDGAEQP